MLLLLPRAVMVTLSFGMAKITTEELYSRYAAGQRDFSGIDLSDCCLWIDDNRGDGCDPTKNVLNGINLSGAKLALARLDFLNLIEANFSGADLSYASTVGHCPQTIYNRSKKTLNCLIRSSNLFTNRSILTILNINIIKSKMVCGQCPPYGILNVMSITYGMLRERIISTLIFGEACHLSETLCERQSILTSILLNRKWSVGNANPTG